MITFKLYSLIIIASITLLLNSFNTLAGEKIDYLRAGNELLAAGRLAEAEAVFRQGVAAEPDNLVFHSQLAFTLIQQGKYNEADKVIDLILLRDPKNAGALWYRALSRFNEKRYQEAIRSFDEVLPLLTPQQGQFQAAHWLTATSYRRRLPIDGLTYTEVDQMIKHYEIYLKAAPSAEDREEVQKFLQWVEKQRPPTNVKRWIVVPTLEDAEKRLMEPSKE